MADDVSCVLVTVGTTSFDQLVKEVSSTNIIETLKKLGYKRLIIQYGRGEFEPAEMKSEDFEVQAFRYKDSIQEDIKSASLVISHAGAGSVMETLGHGKPLVVIINEQLMGNHQLELARQLAEDGHLMYGTCSELSGILRDIDIARLKPYQAGDPKRFSSFLDKFMGVS